VFLGANPARITQGRWTVLAPMAAEEELALELLEAMGPGGRGIAVVSDVAPDDIRSARDRSVTLPLEPTGIGAHQLAPRSRELLNELVALYVGRVPEQLAAQLTADLAGRDLHFAWEGRPDTSGGHYYRIQGPNLLIEYDNTDNGANHCHTVLRRPLGDYGYDILAAHHRAAHG
jgi:hypothetical protein